MNQKKQTAKDTDQPKQAGTRSQASDFLVSEVSQEVTDELLNLPVVSALNALSSLDADTQLNLMGHKISARDLNVLLVAFTHQGSEDAHKSTLGEALAIIGKSASELPSS